MIFYKRYIIYLLPAILMAGSAAAQKSDKEKDLLRKARNASRIGLDLALPIYLQLYAIDSNNVTYNYNIGLCYLDSKGEKVKAVPYFERATRTDDYPNAWYYLGQAYQLNMQFDQAIAAYKKYFSHLSPIDRPVKQKEIMQRITMCNNGKILLTTPVNVAVENMGKDINSPSPDYGPIISPDETMLLFTSRREGNKGFVDERTNEYNEDIYIAERDKSTITIDTAQASKTAIRFNKAKQFSKKINTGQHDAAIGLSPDGQILYISREEAIYTSNIKGFKWSVPVPFNDSLSREGYVPSIYFSPDASTVYFSSDRKGGYGGLDIYKAVIQPNGSWGKPENLGPNVNTEYDEDAPFISPDEKTFYFSSKGHTSMGGYDVFKCSIDSATGRFSLPENLGYPINNPDDDLSFVTTREKNVGFIASIRNGYDMDIFQVSLKGNEVSSQTIKGFVFTGEDLRPAAPVIKVVNRNTGSEIAEFTADSLTGKYFFSLPSDTNYQLVIMMEGRKPYTQPIYPGTGVNSYVQHIYITPVKTPKGRIIGERTLVLNSVNDVYSEDTSLQRLASEDRMKQYEELVKGYDSTQYSELSSLEYFVPLDSVPVLMEEVKPDTAASAAGTNSDTGIVSDITALLAGTTVYFGFNRSELNGNEKEKLSPLVEALKSHPDIRIEIAGYADNTGSSKVNLKLSERRARTVQQYLRKQGIKNGSLKVKGYGEANPAVPNDTSEGRSKNRRVEFKSVN